MKHHPALLTGITSLCSVVLLLAGGAMNLGRPQSPLGEIITRAKPDLSTELILPTRVVGIRGHAAGVSGADELLRADDRSASIDLPATSSASIVLDFGREVVGYLKLQASGGPAGFDLAYGESLQECLQDKPYQPIDHRIAHSGTDTERRAFRYLRITVSNCRSPLAIDYVGLESVGYPVEDRGDFRCSDERLNHIWETGRYTARLCMQGFYEDGIKRDRRLWTGDLRIQALSGYYAFGDYRLARLDLLRLAANQLPDGSIPTMGPDPSTLILPDYCAYWVSTLWEYYLHSGDVETLKLLYPHMQRQMAWFGKHINSDSLIGRADRPGWWCFIDWADIDRHDQVTALQAAYHEALASAERIAEALGDAESAGGYRGQAARVRRAVNDLLWSESAGAYADCRTAKDISRHISLQTNVLAVSCGVADSGRWDGIYRTISDPSRVQPAITPYMNFYVARALLRMGRDQAALDLIRDYWGGMVERGATTFWEIYDPRKPKDFVPDSDMSFCHGWSSGVVSILPSEVAGIKPLAPGFREVAILPHLGDLTWVEARVPTPLGDASASWKQDERVLRGSVIIPSGATATIGIPWDTSTSLLRLDGRVLWRNGEPVTGATSDGHHLLIKVRSGRHTITAE